MASQYINAGILLTSRKDFHSNGLIIPQMGIVKELTRDFIRTKSQQGNHTDLPIEKVMTCSTDAAMENLITDPDIQQTISEPHIPLVEEANNESTLSTTTKDLTHLRGDNRISNSTDNDASPDTARMESDSDNDISVNNTESETEKGTADLDENESHMTSAVKEDMVRSPDTSHLSDTSDGEIAINDDEDESNDSSKPADCGTENEDKDGLNTAQIDDAIILSDSYSSQSQRSNSKNENSSDRKRTAKQQQYVPYYGDPNERAKAKRIRFMLREAMINNDLDELDEAIYLFETSDMVDLGDLTDAINRMEILQLKKDLQEAIKRRNLGILNRAIGDTYSTKHDKDLRHLLDRAEELRDHLDALNHYTHDILEMDHNLISEIRSYCSPPPSVHEVMAACYMLLGIREERLLEWSEVQAHVGRTGQAGLKKMIQSFDPDRVPVHTVLRVKEILNFYNLQDVRVASNGAASFYIWAKNMVDLVDKRRLQNSKEDQERAKSSAKKG